MWKILPEAAGSFLCAVSISSAVLLAGLMALQTTVLETEAPEEKRTRLHSLCKGSRSAPRTRAVFDLGKTPQISTLLVCGEWFCLFGCLFSDTVFLCWLLIFLPQICELGGQSWLFFFLMTKRSLWKIKIKFAYIPRTCRSRIAAEVN